MSKGTTRRTVRIEDGLWERVRRQAADEGLDTSTLIRQLLAGWLDQHDDNGGAAK